MSNQNSRRTSADKIQKVLPQNTFTASNIKRCEKYVSAMQERLDKAVADNDKALIRTIFTILVKRSWAVKVLAVWRITYLNKGKYTAGIDDMKIPHAEKQQQDKMRWRLLQEININSKPDTIRRVYIPKANGKKRPLGIPTLKDRINQEILRIALDPIIEYYSDDDSYGFRPKRSCHDAMSMLYICLSRQDRRRYIIEGDIKSCFDNISHNHILWSLRTWNIPIYAIRIIRKMLKAKVFDKDKFHESIQGTPQGGVISPMLANVALSSFDYYIRHFTDAIMIRYADDFVILCKSKTQAKQIKEDIAKYLYETIGLTLSKEKTHITHIKDGFNFLGFTFRKYPKRGIRNPKSIDDYKMLITPDKERKQNFLKKCKEVISKGKAYTQESLISLLNPLLRGWGNYYMYVNSSLTFNYVDFYLWHRLLKWGKRRHNRKGGKWVVDHYFRNENLNFGSKTLPLIRLAKTPLITYSKFKRGIRVYCKEDSKYWRDREIKLMYKKTLGLTNRLLKGQKGICPHCNTPFTREDTLHIHHILPKALGGNDSYSNLQLLHAECHRELHSKINDNSRLNYAY